MSWTRADPIIIDHTQCGSSDSSNWDFVFQGTYPDLKTTGNGGSVTSASGYDIIFAADSLGATPYSFERVAWDGTSGSCEFWVKIPTLSHTSDTTLYVLSGNASVTTDQQDIANTWSSSFVAVRHLQSSSIESISGSSSTDTSITYSSGNGQIGNGAGLNGSTSQIVCSGGTGNITTNFTVSLWANASSFAHSYNATEVNSDGNGRGLWVKSNGKLACYVTTSGTNTDYDGTGSNTLSTGTWYHLAYSWDGITVKGYVNGALDGSATGALTIHNANSERLGSDAGTAGRNWTGALDEARWSSVVRSDDWILAEYNNQNLPWHFYKTPTLAGGNTSTANARISEVGLSAIIPSPAPNARISEVGVTAIVSTVAPHAFISQIGMTAIVPSFLSAQGQPVIRIIT